MCIFKICKLSVVCFLFFSMFLAFAFGPHTHCVSGKKRSKESTIFFFNLISSHQNSRFFFYVLRFFLRISIIFLRISKFFEQIKIYIMITIYHEIYIMINIDILLFFLYVFNISCFSSDSQFPLCSTEIRRLAAPVNKI